MMFSLFLYWHSDGDHMNQRMQTLIFLLDREALNFFSFKKIYLLLHFAGAILKHVNCKVGGSFIKLYNTMD